ncbi:hypothetical protein SLS55_004950 [Diplodia seriata]|uniref:Uncharacterized protein n=1 Tax=Diplodia seriata TaxID=420778 RepID=A0ABR3CKU3_9PEZI
MLKSSATPISKTPWISPPSTPENGRRNTPPPCTAFVLYEDLLQHFALAEADPGGSSTPIALTGFVRGFVVNKWIAYLNHAHSTFLALRNRLFAPGHNPAAAQDHDHPRYSAKWGGVWEEWMFERMAAFVLELSLFRADLECDMRELGLDPRDDHAPPPSGSCCGCRGGVVGRREGQMWRYVRDQLECTKADYKDLIEMYVFFFSRVFAVPGCPYMCICNAAGIFSN